MKKMVLFSAFILFIMQSCTEPIAQKMTISGSAQGTYYAITYFDIEARDFKSEVDSILAAFDQSVSVYQPNSIVSRVNRNEDVELDEWFIGNFNLSQEISQKTDGAFDQTIAPIANVWGFGTYEKPDVINHELIDSLKRFVDYKKVSIEGNKLVKADERIQLNYNAIAQGYAVDVLARFFEKQSINCFLIDIGGEIYAKGSKPNGDYWKVGIEIPEEGSTDRSFNKIIKIKDEAVATSGNYRKFYEIDGVKYAHSLNPKTGYPVKHSLLSTTVIAPSSAEADAYATAFMIMGVEKTLEFVKNQPQIKVYLMYDEDGQLKTVMSDNFQSYLSDATR